MVAQVLAIVVGTLAVGGTLVPILRHDAWWIRVFDFPRIHMLVLALAALVLVFLAARPEWSWIEISGAAVLLAAVLLQALQILPYTPLWRHQVHSASSPAPGSTLKLVVANVLMTNRNTGDLLRLVRAYEPDLLLTLESDAHWADALSQLDGDYPHVVGCPLDNTYGIMLHARLPLEEPDVRFVLQPEIPSIHAFVTLADGHRIRLYCLHPRPPYPKEADDTTQRDAELLVVGQQVASRDEIAIVAGDFNDVAWSHTTRLFQRISSMLDPRIGRGMFNTFHAGNPLLRWPLDHVFHTEHFKLVRLERMPGFGSDHFPIFIELALDGNAPAEHDEPVSDEEDREEADEKISKARSAD